MKIGHVLALIGSLLVVAGTTVLDWQHFTLAELTALAHQVPVTGQGILGLGIAMALTSVLGLVTRKRNQFATVTLFLSVCLFGWLVTAHVTRSSAFSLMPYEIVEMLMGYTVAVWGSFFTFFGALTVLAAEPTWDPNSRFLRVALLWGETVIQERILYEPQTFRIGEDLRNDFIIPSEKLDQKFPLFRAGGDGQYDIGLSSELAGNVTINKETQSIAEFVKNSTDNTSGINFRSISPGDWGIVELDDLAVYFQFVQQQSRVPRKGFLAFDEVTVAAIALSFLMQVGFMAYSVLSWQETAIRIVRNNEVKIPKVEAIVIDPEEPEELDGEEDDTTAKRAEDEEGKFGDPEEDPLKETKVPKNEAKMVDKIDPKKVGLNDLLSTDKLGGEGAIANILNSNTSGFSNKIAVAMAGEGSEFVLGHGSGGLGFQGTGTGGGGDGGYGRIHGMGKIDTGGGMGVRAGLGKKGKRRVGKLKVGSGATQGFCKKGNIKSVVKRRAGAIRACYESRLQLNPKLSGKLTARWTISIEGKVSGVAVTQNSVKDGKVTNCVLRVLRRMRFQKPEGGICVVQWPFVFNAGG
ncbi:MAG: AgmX/PglI C-terminal domain-containing protein [Myxococcota bacterium]|nr:AgmX/PglI C-terminal domain-containing protein [Myxococcota bacterium]